MGAALAAQQAAQKPAGPKKPGSADDEEDTAVEVDTASKSFGFLLDLVTDFRRYANEQMFRGGDLVGVGAREPGRKNGASR